MTIGIAHHVRSLATLFERGARRALPAKLRLAEAYQAVFSGNATRMDAEIVLADMARHSGFYQVTGPLATDAAVRFAEGQRSVFARIQRFIRLTPDEDAALQAAARNEAIADNTEGAI